MTPSEEAAAAVKYAVALIEGRIPVEGPANRPALRRYADVLRALLDEQTRLTLATQRLTQSNAKWQCQAEAAEALVASLTQERDALKNLAMLYYSDPHKSAQEYRQGLREICNAP